MAVPDQGEGTYWPHCLEWVEGKKGERFVFKWGLEVGEIDRLSLHTIDRERKTEKCF